MEEPQVLKLWHIIFSAFIVLLYPVAVFAIAGDFKWIEGWIFAVIWLIWMYALLIYWIKKDPGLLRERFASPIQKEKKEEQDIQQKRWDKPIIAILVIFFIVWIIGTPLDAKRFALSPEFPILAKVIGVIFLNIGSAIVLKAYIDNPFASHVVRIQKDRKQKVVSTGIYSIVRHPIYLGGIVLIMGMPVLLGSFIGVGCTIVISILFAIRAVKEERTLADELEGYDEYCKKVHYRIIPFIF
ncbi:MAG: isoprenylcysteine carboxylmethyltransferase family protein [Theionarchaea archaeon]|nr:isoprenylcysteine carboxylmethyltransferase family protein [Theionarchaea archaeon]